jgi:capsular polysaccharide biosynthesis protein
MGFLVVLAFAVGVIVGVGWVFHKAMKELDK